MTITFQGEKYVCRFATFGYANGRIYVYKPHWLNWAGYGLLWDYHPNHLRLRDLEKGLPNELRDECLYAIKEYTRHAEAWAKEAK